MCDKNYTRLLSTERGQCRICGGACPPKKDLCHNCADSFHSPRYVEE